MGFISFCAMIYHPCYKFRGFTGWKEEHPSAGLKQVYRRLQLATGTPWVGHQAAGRAAMARREALPIAGRTRPFLSPALKGGESLRPVPNPSLVPVPTQ